MNHHTEEQPNCPMPGSWSACYDPAPTFQETELPPLAEVERNTLVRRGRVRTIQEVREVTRLRHPVVIPILIRALQDPMLHTESRDCLRILGEPAYRCLLLAAQNHKHKKERLQAIIALGDWSDNRAVPILLAAIHSERREALLEKGIYWSVVGILGVVFGAFVVLICAVAPNASSNLFGTGWGDSSMKGVSYATALRQACLESLARIGDPRAIAPLISIMHSGDTALSASASSALLKIVPRVGTLRMEQAHLLPAETVPQLASLVEEPNITLARYALEALHAIGDGRALPHVRHLANQPPSHDADKHTLREYARFLVPILRERAQQDAMRQTLLRGASAPVAPNELLRPISGRSHPSHASSELLRPTSAQPE